MDCSPPGSSIHGIFQAEEYWSGVPLPSPVKSLLIGKDPDAGKDRRRQEKKRITEDAMVG